MPRKQSSSTNFKNSPLQVTLLLVQFLLIQLGKLPLRIINFVLNLSDFIVKIFIHIIFAIGKFLSQFKLSHPSPITHHSSLFLLRRKPGRPRKSWLLPYYLNKFRFYYRRKVTKKTKLALLLSLILIFFLLYTQFILTAAYQLPSPEGIVSYSKPITSEILDRNGRSLYKVYEGRNRILVKLEDLPQYLIDATIAAEDKNFHKHIGVDFEAILRALYHNIKYGRVEGASTITQQLVKNSLLTPEKTYTRKFKEIILALWTETKYSKNKILQMYFNEAPFGGPNWGVRAASLAYFDKEPKDLTVAEAAYLAGLPASPAQFSPVGTRPDLGLERQKQVLSRMLNEGYLTVERYNKALSEKLNFKAQTQAIQAPHFVFYIKNVLSSQYGERVVSQAGLKIHTTLDLTLQEEVEKIVAEEVGRLGSLHVSNGAAMVLDAKTGQILAMVGSKNYFDPNSGNFNVTLAPRPPGSSIKPITYATAFKLGYSPGNTILDAPVSFRDGVNLYSPVNYDGKFHGPVSLRTALASSYNVPAVKLLQSVGLSEMLKTARDLGITTLNQKERYGLSLTLGGGDVPMIEMMGAYQAFSQLGSLKKPTGILKVTDAEGNTLEEYQDLGRQVLSPEVAYLISSILSDNKARTPAFGADSLLHFREGNLPVKTGTSDNKRDNWTFGYTPDFVVGVWVGNMDNSPMHPSLASGVTGAAPIWNQIMKKLLAQKPLSAFSRPPGIVEMVIDGRKDLAIAGTLPKGLVRVRKESDKTIYSDSFSSYATSSAQAKIGNGTTN